MAEETFEETKVLDSVKTEIMSGIVGPLIPVVSIIAGPDKGHFFDIRNGDQKIFGSSSLCDVVLSDVGVSSKHLRIVDTQFGLSVEDLHSRNGVYLNAKKIKKPYFIQSGDKVLFGESTVLHVNYVTRLEFEHQTQINKNLEVDELTQTLNRRSFVATLHKEYVLAKKKNSPLTVLVFDIDHFKKVNDTYGHLAGDEVLVAVSNILLQASTGNRYFVCRYGGEEFVVITTSDKAQALSLAERIREKVESTQILLLDDAVQVTVSVGVSSFPEDEDTASSMVNLVDHADKAMYRAKQSGRNKVCAY